MMKAPLSGLRIVSFEAVGAAPYATMFLAAFGAEVIRIEPPGGDPARRTGPLTLGENDSLYFQSLNLSKKSAILDLSNADDRVFFHQLVRISDAVVNNLRGDVPARLGLDYRSLAGINSKIVCGHISAYGRDNARAGWPGFDFLMQAEAGLMSLTGEPGSIPARSGVSIIDYMTGMMLAFGLVSALRGAEQSGQGADIDASLFDTAIHQLCYQGVWYLNEGIVTRKTPRSAHPMLTPVQLFSTADGWLYIAAMTDKFWIELVGVLDNPQLSSDPRFASMTLRSEHREALTELLDCLLKCQTTEAWVEKFGGRVPIAPVYDLAQALDNPFLHEIGMIASVPHSQNADMKAFGIPIKINGERPQLQPAPKYGQDSIELHSVVKEADRIRRLKAV